MRNNGSWTRKCSGRDLNPHALRHTPLKRTCLPVSPPEQIAERNLYHGKEPPQVFCAAAPSMPFAFYPRRSCKREGEVYPQITRIGADLEEAGFDSGEIGIHLPNLWIFPPSSTFSTCSGLKMLSCFRVDLV